jgi:hypothetical protein
MSFTYRMEIDEAYARTFLKRFTQLRFRHIRIVAIAICLFSLGGSLAFFALQDPAVLPMLLRTMAFTLLPAVLILALLVPLLRSRQVKRIVAAAKGGVSVTLSEVGISSTSANSESRTDWSAYDHVLRYDDGLMFMRMKNLPTLWLPDHSLVDASPEAVTSFVGKRLPLKHVV